jgi:acetyl-CoA C-acetyltransferase
MICFPYTKVMNAIMEVDLAAAVILTSADEARRLGIAADKLVYIHGAADATDRWWISERESLARAPMLDRCVNAAIDGAGISADNIAHFDFYSCFPVALEMAMEGSEWNSAIGVACLSPAGCPTRAVPPTTTSPIRLPR